MPLTEPYPLSFDQAMDVLEKLGDFTSVAEPFWVVTIDDPREATHFHLRWSGEGAIPFDEDAWAVPTLSQVAEWLRQNAPTCETHECVNMSFWTAKALVRFKEAAQKVASASQEGGDK